MPEKEKAPFQFDPEVIGQALHTAAHPTTDLAFGPGQRYDLARGQASLEVFPERPLTRLTTATARIELFDSPPPQVVHDQLVFGRQQTQEDATLTVSAEGTVVFGYISCPPAPDQPATALEPPQEPPLAAAADDAPPAAEQTPPAAHSSPARTRRSRDQVETTRRPNPTSSPAVPTPPAAATAAPIRDRQPADTQPEQQPRLQLTGRLGRDPSFRTSPRGTLVSRFPLAVHRDDGTTTWHTILAFGERATQLQHRFDAGELAKGQEVNLVGYPHTRAQPTRDGGRKTVTEIYAVAVTRR